MTIFQAQPTKYNLTSEGQFWFAYLEAWFYSYSEPPKLPSCAIQEKSI